MKKLIFILILFSTLAARSQSWEALGNGLGWPVRGMYSDTVDNYLYATGAFLMHTADGRQLKSIARWDGIKWDSVGNGVTAGANTFAFARYHNDLYVGGTFDSVGYIKCKGIGIWTGTSWDTMAVQPFKNNYASWSILSMKVINDELYFGGSFDSINNVPCLNFAKWNGTAITPIGFPPTVNWGRVLSICEFNNEVYIAGNFSSTLYPYDTIQDIIKYNGTSWRSVGGGMKGALTIVNTLAVYNNELYAGGYFFTADGNTGDNIQKWNGTNWTHVGGGVDWEVRELIVYNGKLFALGLFSNAGGIPCNYTASWDGTNWCAEGSTFDNIITNGCIYKDSLCIGGGFWTINGDSMNFISKWTGGGFADTCGNLSIGINEQITSTESLSLYPNPTQSTLIIQLSEATKEELNIEIKNMLGQTLQTLQLPAGNKQLDIDVSLLAKGIYFVHCQSKDVTISKKFIKQ